MAVRSRLRVGVLAVVSQPMNDTEETALRLMLAKHREASVRADDTIDAQRETIASQRITMEAQREVIDLLHAKIGEMERQMEELRAAL